LAGNIISIILFNFSGITHCINYLSSFPSIHMSFKTDGINSMSPYDQDIFYADYYILLYCLNALAFSISKQQTCSLLRDTEFRCFLYNYPRLLKTRFVLSTDSLNLHQYWSTLSLSCSYYSIITIIITFESSLLSPKVFLLSHYTLL
jgi:hypothetical protein